MDEAIYRDGIPIEKGMVLTTDFLDDNKELITNYLNLWMLYPDLYLDAIKQSSDKYFKFYFYQRIALRAAMRYRQHFLTATRGASKSFISYLSSVIQAVFCENSKLIIVSQTKGTVVKIAKQKFEEIWEHWPLLYKELKTRGDDGEQGEKKSSDNYEIAFKNGSRIFVISKDTSRGIRATGAILEECALIDGVSYTEIILPQMNIARRDSTGYLDPNEPTPRQTYITTAATKTCFMYSKLIEIAVMSVLKPDEYFVWGLSYEVPVKYGLLSKKQLDEQRFSNTMNQESFARESMSIWTGNSEDAWIDSSVLEKKRTLLHAERKEERSRILNAFYIISADVARYQANTAISVIKVIPQAEHFKKNLVYLEIIQGKNFITDQAPRIKELAELYMAREIVIDGNGLGAGLMDAMVLPSVGKNGKQYPAYFAFNDEAYLPPQRLTEDEEPMPQFNAIIYNLKANASNDEEIHANFFSQISSGYVSFLAPERVVKDKLMATKGGQKMSAYDKRVFLLPYEMTSRLMDEISNLRLKPTGIQNRLQVERISNSTQKDRFSSLEYGLYRVKYYEDRYYRHSTRRDGETFTFFTPKNDSGRRLNNRRRR